MLESKRRSRAQDAEDAEVLRGDAAEDGLWMDSLLGQADRATADAGLGGYVGAPVDVDRAWGSSAGRARALGVPVDPAPTLSGSGRPMAHERVDLTDGVRAGGVPWPSQSTDVTPLSGEVVVWHDRTNPLVTAAPREDQLYTLGSSGTPVTRRLGSVADPDVDPEPDADAVFIGGMPDVRDVVQGQLGDCYFLSVVADIAQTDPSHLLDVVRPSGPGAVDVTLHHRTEDSDGTYAWTPMTITTARTALHFTDTGGLVGAGVRVADAPVRSAWVCDLAAPDLRIARIDLYEMALWVALLEKAYARFAGLYGADGKSGSGVGTGYDPIAHGGREGPLFRVLYGDSGDTRGSRTEDPVPGQDLLHANFEVIVALVRQATAEGGRNVFLTATIEQDRLVTRLLDHCRSRVADPASTRYPALLRALERVVALADAWLAAPMDDHAYEALVAACRREAEPGRWPLLADADATEWVTTGDLLASVGELGDQPYAGGLPADHSISVLGATFVDRGGAPLAPTLHTLAEQLDQVDGDASQVTMRNPWGIDPSTARGGQGENDGVYEISLNRFLIEFDWVVLGSAPKE